MFGKSLHSFLKLFKKNCRSINPDFSDIILLLTFTWMYIEYIKILYRIIFQIITLILVLSSLLIYCCVIMG